MNPTTTAWIWRTIFFSFFLPFCCLPTHAQGIYQMRGMTYDGGVEDMGMLFSTDSNGANLTARHQFTHSNIGANPRFGAMSIFNGKLYGFATKGEWPDNKAVLFEFDPATSIYTPKVIFTGGADGGLTEYNGAFYGAVRGAGAYGKGELFKYEPLTGTYTKLVDFVESMGFSPNGPLTLFNDKFYGLTTNGGSAIGGVLFEFDPSTNVYTKKVDCGGFPENSLTLYNNKLYGMLPLGGTGPSGANGTLFEYDPVTNNYVTKVNFASTNGYNPQGSLTVQNGKLWGMTSGGGANGGGVLFQYDPITNIYTKKIDLSDANGSHPMGDLTPFGNKLLGLTYQGGTNNLGVLFEYDASQNSYTKRVNLSSIGGSSPYGSLVELNGLLYGYTYQGGSQNMGALFEYNPQTYAYTKKMDFNNLDAGYPQGGLTYLNNKLYGLAIIGGPAGGGAIIQYDLATNSTSNAFSFDTISGRYPMGDLVAYNNRLFGITTEGGSQNKGVVFSYEPSSKLYTKLIDFNGNNGGFARDHDNTNLTLFSSILYGFTQNGGSNDAGVLFSIDPATNAYTKKIDFNSSTGSNPCGYLLAWHGKLYGITRNGGLYNQGVLFEYDPATNGYAVKFNFQSPSSFGAAGYIILYNDKFYGLSDDDGDDYTGLIFEFDPATNIYTRKFELVAPTGTTPYGGLNRRNNMLYGTTSLGGKNNKGVVFSYDPSTNNYTKTSDFDDINTGAESVIVGSLVSIPASVADGNIGACTALPSFSIANPANSNWIGITDQFGNAIAEINPNGNDLGVINASFYVQTNPVRNAGGFNYLNRSVTITVEHQPAADKPVSLRFYIKKSELDDLINTPGSGISSVNDLSVFKSENVCSNNIGNDVAKLTTSASDWGPNFVLTTQTTSFSTFHFSTTNSALPVTLLSFTAVKKDAYTNQLDWQTSSEINSDYFSVERSTDGAHFLAIGTVAASNNSSNTKSYRYYDPYSSASGTYYRIKMVDKDGKYTYSKVIKLYNRTKGGVTVSPNPASTYITISGGAQYKQISIIDISGRIVQQFSSTTGQRYDISQLPRGIYTLRLMNGNDTVMTKFIKL